MSDRDCRVVGFGDRALLVETTDVATAHALAAVLDAGVDGGRAPTGIDDVVIGFANVVVVLDPDVVDHADVVDWVAGAAEVAGAGSGTLPAGNARPARTHVLPVVFDGADLGEVAALLDVAEGRVVELMVSAELEVAFVGFAPGFPYLTGLPPELAGLARRATPRTSVPAGSVAVAAGFASVYPRATPGGWHLLGRTAASLFDPDVPPYSRVAPGDRVRFEVDHDGLPQPAADDDDERPLLDADGPCLVVVEPGLATTVQDAGRIGCARLGVPTAGAADPRSLALANRLVGNPAGAAGLECTASGPVVQMVGDGLLAVVGSGPGAVDVTVAGHPMPDGVVLPVTDGQVVRIGPVGRGLRAYLAVSGGLATPVLFGSRSSDTLAGLGPGAVRAGDRLARGAPTRAHARLDWEEPVEDGPTELRVVAGPHGWPVDGLCATTWRVGSEVDRIGMRLDATDGSVMGPGRPRASTPMVTGAVQIPPDGRPIVLLPDHATVGGYPVVACVIAADVARLGQLAPGAEIAFTAVDLATAQAAYARARRADAFRVSGWFPTTAGT